MNPCRWQAIVGLAVLLAVAPPARAQRPQQRLQPPHVGYVYPAGGRQGATFDVTVGGQFLEDVTKAYVSGKGVQVTVGKYVRPLTPKEANALRDKIQDARKRAQAEPADGPSGGGRFATFMKLAREAGVTEEDMKALAQFRQNRADPKRQLNPQLAETITLQIKLMADAAPGQRELRLATAAGLSNPIVFCVGQLPEFSGRPATDRSEPISGVRALLGKAAKSDVAKTEMSITLPAVVNGQIMPGGVDRFRFKARKGQRLLVAASARELIPYLADAVPGWFQATLALYDGKGRELDYAGNYLFHPDPILYYEIPADDEYVVEIKDSVYRGREDFVYRITLGELPFVTGIFPLGGRVGIKTSVALKGWNLPVASLTPTTSATGIHLLAVHKDDVVSNQAPFAVDTLPECLEQEPNNRPEDAQPVTLPVVVNGRIDRPGDWDVFRVDGHAGDTIVAEVYSRRLNSPLDSVLKLIDAVGKQLAFNDDHEDKGSGLNTHHADSYLSVALPASGAYYVHLGDAQHQGGSEYAYRLRISRPRPDFELRVVPSSINVRGGASVPLSVYALRKDGFSGEITLSLNGAPKGFALSGGTVPAGQDKLRFTLTVPPTALEEPVNLRLEGRAMIHGREVLRPAVPAEDMMQAFAYRHLVPAKELKVEVTNRFMARFPVKMRGEGRVKIPAGGTTRVKMDTPPGYADRVHLELSEPPDGITIQKVSSDWEGTEIVLRCDAAKVKPGLKGNLIVNTILERTPADKEKAKAAGNQRRVPVGCLPAIPFEVVARRDGWAQ